MRWKSVLWIAMPAALAGLAASCSHDTANPSTPAGQTLAAEMSDGEIAADVALGTAIDGQVDGAADTADVTFGGTYNCPAGGTIAWQGSLRRTYDPATRTLEAQADGTRTTTDCARTHGTLTTVVNGSAAWDAYRKRVDGAPSGLQTTHHSGSWTAVRSDGLQKACSFDVTIVRDPAARTRTLDGTICGTTVHKVVTWQPGT